MEKEIWVDVIGYEGIYMVSNFGNVKSVDRQIVMSHGGIKFQVGKMLVANIDNLGFLKVNLYDNNRTRKTFRIHRLVAMHFVNNPNDYTYVNFDDCNKENVKASNLKWVSDLENNSKGGTHSYKFKNQKEIA